MKAILSIKPQFVEKIISGEKIFEFRKKIFKQEVESVIIYSTKPVCRFIGEFTIESILSGDRESVWSKTHMSSGITREYFDEYFKNSKTAYALKVDEVRLYDTPINPFETIPNFTAPQSFCYERNIYIE